MKRSQMLGKIWELLYKETDYEEVGLQLLCEQILDTIENSGMLPPFNRPWMDSSNGESTHDIKNYNWEPEDE